MVNLTFESVHEIPWSDLLKTTSPTVLSLGTISLVCILSLLMKSYGVTTNETCSAVLSHVTIYLVCSSNF